MKQKNYLFLGCGNMGEPVLNAFLESGINPKNIWVVEPGDDRRAVLQKRYEINTLNVGELLENEIGVVVLAIKPQQLDQIDFSQVSLSADAVVVSILAGTAMEVVASAVGQKKVARFMPNLPLMFGRGMTSFIGQNLSNTEEDFLVSVFEKSGKVLRLKTEDDMHAATLIAGSGPGVFYFFASEFQKVAQEYGFSSQEAQELVKETFTGSALFAEKSSDTFADLQGKVTSKGGTTEAAIASLKSLGFYDIFQESIQQGVDRSKKLSS